MFNKPKLERAPESEISEEYLMELENKINALNDQLGYSRVKMVDKEELNDEPYNELENEPEDQIETQEEAVEEDLANGRKRQSLEEIKAAGKNDVYDPAEMQQELEKAMAREEEFARFNETLKNMARVANRQVEAEKAADDTRTIARIPYANDPDMQEIVLQEEMQQQDQEREQEQEQEQAPKEQQREIDVIGQGTEPINKEIAKDIDRLMAIQKELEVLNQDIATLRAEIGEPEELPEPEEDIKEPETLDELQKELESLDQEIADLKTEIGSMDTPENTPLVAVGVDWMKSEDKLAKKLAREDLKAEMKDSGLIKRIWKGRLFREYYEEKYMDEYLKGHRKSKDGRDLYEIIDNQKQELMNDIVFGVTDDIRNANQKDWDKRLAPVDEETNEKIKSTIEDYARFMYDLAEVRPDMAKNRKLLNEVDDRFDRYMIHILEQAEEEGRIDGYIETNNYLFVAKEAARRYKEAMRNAKDKVEQDAAMAKVMIGFRAYNYESIKTFSEERRDNVDKIIDNLGSDKIGQFVPAEDFSEAVDAITRAPEENKIINNIKRAEDSIGGKEGVKIMLDKSPITTSYMARCQKWWNSLSDDGKKRVEALVVEIDSYPNRYDVEWGNGFRTWFNLRNKLVA